MTLPLVTYSGMYEIWLGLSYFHNLKLCAALSDTIFQGNSHTTKMYAFSSKVYDPATKKSCFVQLGIVSWGYGCGQLTEIKFKDFQYPGYYTDVRSMMAWITDTMKK